MLKDLYERDNIHFSKIMIYDILFIAVDLHKVVSQWATTGASRMFALTI